ncbi:MAG TPA: glyceraldehyde 3-phosphate dehydrogenase NAD-binding domain-containing protein, partial [Bacteroidia bacterium]|nr:glyceraldehyde 3-phosphate dehydrogenase NAD-binding domain-containing protein [Bacteroidia bacterium]
MNIGSMEQKKGKASFESELAIWIDQERAALEFIGIVGNLWYDKSVELVIFRNQLIDRSASEVMNLHQYAKDIVKKPIHVHDTLALAKELFKLELVPSRIDIGKLATEWNQEKDKSAGEFLRLRLGEFIGHEKFTLVPKDVVLYGFGRIGRLAARELISQAGKGEQLRLRAIVTRDKSDEDIIKRADLLRTDSVHGPFAGTVIADVAKRTLIVNGHVIHMISAASPESIDYTSYGIHDALLIDNTGI